MTEIRLAARRGAEKTVVPVDGVLFGSGFSLVPPLCLAAAAAGADGLIVEVQVNPQEAVCDRSQTLSPDEFAEVARQASALHGLLHPPAAETREEV